VDSSHLKARTKKAEDNGSVSTPAIAVGSKRFRGWELLVANHIGIKERERTARLEGDAVRDDDIHDV
jgi:hypothetical protein